ncbi:DUF3772 domain-containing protein [Roseiarcaceae bacterium H3SJ34-1]|uniref:DUF3772 domain-containing protein n=1 Tax=Terripilifer ovatus TaxID=3032367 RepID=UPI003AB94020|nr:DUF3772 domain-containing protein [Roseiarcaceae bacterium H3SJ34-1]
MIQILRSLFASLCLVLALAGAHAQTADQTVVQKLDAARNALTAVEKSLAGKDLTDAALQSLRADLDPVSGKVQEALDELNPRLDAVKTRLDQLGAKPAVGAPAEAAGVTSERDDQQKRFNEIDAQVKRARLLAVQVSQVGDSIVNRRRANFRQALFQLSSSILSPSLWIAAISDIPRDIQTSRYVFMSWFDNAVAQMRGSNGFVFAAMLAAIAIGYAVAKIVARRILTRKPSIKEPTRLAKAVAALWTTAVTAVAPIVATIAVFATMRAFNLLVPGTEGMVQAVSESISLIAITHGFIRGLLAPGNPDWRLLDLKDDTADRLAWLAITVAMVVAGLKIAEAFNDLVAAKVQVSVFIRGVIAAAVALIMTYALYGMVPAPDPADDCFGPPLEPKRDWYGVWRLCAWAAIAAILIADLIGYIALAKFLVDQVLWITLIGSVMYLLSIIAEDGLKAAFQPQAPIGRAIMNSIGLKGDSLIQVSVILRGAISVILSVVAALLILAPWGIESDDMIGTVRAAFFGFQVGDITISLATVFTALVLFAVGFIITRAVQNWLEGSLLPHTHLDLGLRNSIRTSAGYIGVLLSLGLALAHVGIGFDKLAIVAGALSIGIGFGLQSVVNNFVSGLILLWERAIRVGDWVVVGDEQGYVRRINVRATEIETFDRATMIVPNSNLVTGVVKNWVRTDRVGRIRVPVAVNMSADADQVRALLLDCARQQELILRLPEPQVNFTAMVDAAMRFDLVCFVSDVEKSQRVVSDLNFTIFRRFRAEHIDMSPPQPQPVVVKIGN